MLFWTEYALWKKKKKNISGSGSDVFMSRILWEHHLISFHFCFCLSKHTNENKYFEQIQKSLIK